MMLSQVRIIESTAVDGVMLRSRSNQVIGKLDGLDDPDCINTLGTSFQWEMTSSSGERVALLANENKAETLKLFLPKNSLTASESYMVQLKASLSGQPTLVHSHAVLGFVVRLQELIPLVSGGGMEATEDVPITLDASPSFDPDSETGDMSFQWRCTRSDGEECRTADGALLPVRLTDPVLGPLNLQVILHQVLVLYDRLFFATRLGSYIDVSLGRLSCLGAVRVDDKCFVAC